MKQTINLGNDVKHTILVLSIDTELLLSDLKKLLAKVRSLEEWTPSNASKLKHLNTERHRFRNYLMNHDLEKITSGMYGDEGIDAEISIAQNTRPKRKADLSRNEGYYYKGKRHLADETEGYINKLELLIEKG